MTKVTVEGNSYTLSDILEIDPALIIDEENKTLRVSIGKPDIKPEEQKVYTELFNALKPLVKEPFAESISFAIGNKILHFKVAYVECIERPYGTFCDIETTLNEYTYEEEKLEGVKKNATKVSKIPRSKT